MDIVERKMPYSIQELSWDTRFFGFSCAKVVLNQALKDDEWCSLKDRFSDFHFVTLENRDSEPSNARRIGVDTRAYLVDVNIQFIKKPGLIAERSESVIIQQAMERDEKLLSIADFPFSRFVEDPELARRGGADVHLQWIINSFARPDKHFAVAEGALGATEGFLLHSYQGTLCTIELICVAEESRKNGVGSRLFHTLEFEAVRGGCLEIGVGTQIRNQQAVNFYHKIGCTQVGCHQVFHLWSQT